jgi:integrase
MGFLLWRDGPRKWYAEYETVDGKRRRRSTGTGNKTLAAKLLRRWECDELEKRAERREGTSREFPDVTFRQFAAKYLRHTKAVNCTSTSRRDRVVIDNVLPHFGSRLLREIRHRDVQEYLDRRASSTITKGGKERRPSPSTIDRERISLSAMFTYAVDNEFIPSDAHPVKRVKIPKGEKFRQRELLQDEEVRLMRAILSSPRRAYLEPVIITALNTGMRMGELLSLKWGNVDLTERLLHGGTVSHGRMTVESTHDNPTKDRTTRYIPVNKVLKPVLEALRLEALRAAEATPEAIRDNYIFVSVRTGSRWKDIGNAWDSALEHAKITGFRFHDLRHTFATRSVRAGMPLEVLQKVLGHSEITTTMRYAHVGDVDVERSMNSVCGGVVVRRKGRKKEQACG